MVDESQEDIQSYIDDVFELISEQPDNTVTRKDLEQEFQKFMEYGVPLAHAKQTLLKKYTDAPSIPTSTERILIDDLETNQYNVTLLGRILSINPKEITARGETKTIFYGLLGDESGTINFTAWHDFKLKKGDVIYIANAYTKEWQGTPQLNFGEKARVEIKKETDVTVIQQEPQEYPVKDFRAGLGAVIATVQIMELNKRIVNVSGTEKTVFSGILADETGKAQFTAWHDFNLAEGDVIKITGGYIKSWKGIPQFTFDEKATVKKLQKKTLVTNEDTTQTFLLHELVEKRGALDVRVSGTIIDIREGSGQVQRCPTCNRVLFNGECSIHGAVEGIDDLRLKLVIDDGTGTVNCTLGRQATEHLLQITMEQWKQKDTENLIKTLYGHRLICRGNALGDQFGTTLIAREAQFNDYNVVQQSDQLLQELEDIA